MTHSTPGIPPEALDAPLAGGRPRPIRHAGQDWLLTCTPRPAAAQHAWDAKELVAFRTGPHWRVAETPLLRSMEAIRWLGGGQGPVLADVHRATMWWLLAPDLSDELDDIRQVTVRPPDWVLKCPPVL